MKFTKIIFLPIVALLLAACSDVCGRIEGPSLVLDAQGTTGCWRYTGEPRCFPTLDSEDACSAPREVFHTGERLTLWCEPEVTAPKAVMVPTECEP